MSQDDLGEALIAALDDETIARLADRLRPHLKAAAGDSALLTATEVGQRLRLHPKTVVRLARDGRLPAVKIGAAWRFQPGQLDVSLARTSTTPQAWPTGRSRRTTSLPGTPASVRAIRGERTA